ncbi:MAG: antibiotic biosynthesis monooxygenase [Alphaproteobacteria bacterium]|nr:antibiotic biosynthesis monooxygenase [Alphaproteobacteria bacterium]|tara:strand:+ start:1060 stop:1359 length:300 start_codon:yes stop_codon:yes gene_type:complete
MAQVAVLAQVDIDPAQKEAFHARVQKHAADSFANEEGCLLFQVNVDQENPNRYVMYEIYRDQAAIEVHMNSDHMAAWRAASADWVKDRELTMMNVVNEV